MIFMILYSRNILVRCEEQMQRDVPIEVRTGHQP